MCVFERSRKNHMFFLRALEKNMQSMNDDDRMFKFNDNDDEDDADRTIFFIVTVKNIKKHKNPTMF